MERPVTLRSVIYRCQQSVTSMSGLQNLDVKPLIKRQVQINPFQCEVWYQPIDCFINNSAQLLGASDVVCLFFSVFFFRPLLTPFSTEFSFLLHDDSDFSHVGRSENPKTREWNIMEWNGPETRLPTPPPPIPGKSPFTTRSRTCSARCTVCLATCWRSRPFSNSIFFFVK